MNVFLRTDVLCAEDHHGSHGSIDFWWTPLGSWGNWSRMEKYRHLLLSILPILSKSSARGDGLLTKRARVATGVGNQSKTGLC